MNPLDEAIPERLRDAMPAHFDEAFANIIQIPSRWDAAVNEYAHTGHLPLYIIVHRCEECMNPLIEILDAKTLREEIRGEDIFIDRQYTTRCPDCGTIEATIITSVIPSWCAFNRREEIRAHPIIPEEYAPE